MAGFRKAKAEQAAIKLGVYGPSGSGKTFTSLLLAEGLGKQSGKRVAFVDTERGTDFYCKDVKNRQCHPAAFDFDALYTKSLTEVNASIFKLNPKEHGVIVIDSITHLWEAARLAYEGKTTKAGTIPFHAWGKIKKPYKELMTFLLSSPMHIIFCGRQGNEYEEDEETGELKATGKKMKAEGETPYEPHILIRMDPIKDNKGSAIVRAYVEKDRTGVLAGQTIEWPDFDKICKPLLPLLGDTQAQMPTEDEVSLQDAEALSVQEKERIQKSEALLREFQSKLNLAKTPAEIATISKAITPDVKKQMLPAHVTELREHYQACETQVANGPRMFAEA